MADALYRVTMGGTLGDAEDEIFSFGFWVAGDLVGSDPDTVGAAWAGYVAAFHAESVSGVFAITSLALAFPSTVRYLTCTVRAYVPGTGLPVSPHGTIFDISSEAGLGTPSQGLPFQTSLVVTVMKAGRGRGLANRWYLPPFVIGATQGEGKVEPGIPDAIGAFLAGWQTDRLADANPTRLVHYSTTHHVISELTHSFTGSIIDTHQSRRNKEKEIRTTVAL